MIWNKYMDVSVWLLMQLCGSTGNVRNAWKLLKEWGSNDEGRDQIREALQLCPAADLAKDDDADNLAQWAQNAFDYMVITTLVSYI